MRRRTNTSSLATRLIFAPTAKLQFHGSSLLVQHLRDILADTPDRRDIRARMSRRCYEETVPAEFQLNPAAGRASFALYNLSPQQLSPSRRRLQRLSSTDVSLACARRGGGGGHEGPCRRRRRRQQRRHRLPARSAPRR